MDKKNKRESKPSEFVKKVSISILVAIFLLISLSLFALPQLKTQYSVKQFLPEDHILLRDDEHMRRAFHLQEVQPFIITAKIKEAPWTWLVPQRIERLQKVTQHVSSLPGIKGALSLATAQGALSTGENLKVGSLLGQIPQKNWETAVQQNSLVSPTLISKDGQIATIIVNIFPLKTQDLQALRNDLMTEATAAIPFAHVEIAGAPAVQTDVALVLQKELKALIGLGLLLCFIVLALIFSNGSPLLASLIVILSANLLVISGMAFLGYPFSILSCTIPILLTVDVLSLCIHTQLRYAEERKEKLQMPHHQLVSHTFRVLLGPNLIASLTTMIGFLALVTVKVPLIRDYGITAACAIVIGWLLTTTMLFPLMQLLPPPQVRDWAWAKARWSRYIFRFSGFGTLLIVFSSIVLAYQGQNLSWSARLFDDLPKNHQVRLSTEKIDKELGGTIPLEIEIKGHPDAWNEPQALAQLNQLINQIRSQPGVGSAVGLPDLIRASHLATPNLPESRAAIAESYFLYSLSNESPLKNFLTADGSSTRLSLRTQDLPENELEELISTIRNMTKNAFPEKQTSFGGMGSTIHRLNNELSRDLIFGFWQSMVAICLLLVIVFKSLRWALVACIPNLVPPAALLGFLALSGTPIKPGIALIFSIALGLAFNNTVYLLERLRQLQRSSQIRGLDIEKTMLLEGNPCLISSLTLLAGFSVFLASYFAMNQSFGIYMLLSVAAGLVGDLILLPAMLKSCPWLLTPLHWKKEKIMSTLAAFFIGFLILLKPHQALALPSAQQIGAKMAQRLSSRDEEFIMTMKIIEEDGSNKDREMHIYRLSPNKKEHSFLVRMLKPLDLKGTALLVVLKQEKEDKWLYLPSSKQTRRLSNENEQGGILGSELNVEDFDLNLNRSAKSILKKEVSLNGNKYYVMESNVDESSANYSKVISYISAKDYLPVKAECFDKKGKLLKIIDISAYKKISSTQWRAGKIKVRNVQNRRSTEITMTNVKLDQNLKTGRFTPRSLSQD